MLPEARGDGLIVRELPDETLVYDLETKEAHCLNPTAAAVWRHCDGETTPSEIGLSLAREFSTPIDEEVVWLALHQLSRRQLLKSPLARPVRGLSRAEVIRRFAMSGAALAVPVVFSLVVPTASAAVCSQPCGGGVVCTGSCPFCSPAAGNTCQVG
jgi:Coenzyme PQQ synthesis protein D (PqqD)